MSITAKDKKIILRLLKDNPGYDFRTILSLAPTVSETRNGITQMKSPFESSEGDLWEYWEELKRTGVIRAIDHLNPDRFTLTEKGRRIAESGGGELETDLVELDKLVVDPRLRAIVAGLSSEDAVFKAFKHIEERVRERAKLPADEVGASLVTKALNPKSGSLRITTCQTGSEQEGVFMLFRGGVLFLKNPSSHRTVDWTDPRQAAEAILFADFLLGLLEKAIER